MLFSNSNPITIKDRTTVNPFGQATPYPSPINVSGLTGSVTGLKVRLVNLSHQFPCDIDILLVGPQQATGFASTGGFPTTLLMSDVGARTQDCNASATVVSSVTLTFDPTVSTLLPDADLQSGTFKVTDYQDVADLVPTDGFVSPDQSFTFVQPQPTDALSRFLAILPNGLWQLFVVDDRSFGSGMIAGGWQLEITTGGTPSPDAAITANPNPVAVGRQLIFSVQGPSQYELQVVSAPPGVSVPLSLGSFSSATAGPFSTSGIPTGSYGVQVAGQPASVITVTVTAGPTP